MIILATCPMPFNARPAVAHTVPAHKDPFSPLPSVSAGEGPGVRKTENARPQPPKASYAAGEGPGVRHSTTTVTGVRQTRRLPLKPRPSLADKQLTETPCGRGGKEESKPLPYHWPARRPRRGASSCPPHKSRTPGSKDATARLKEESLPWLSGSTRTLPR